MKVEILQYFGDKAKGTVIDLPTSLATSLIRKQIAKVFVAKKAKEVKEAKTEK
jgi:hypothetical protein